MKILCRYILIAAVLSLLPSCCDYSVWEKGNIELFGSHCLAQEREYNKLGFGHSEDYIKKLPDIFIDWPTGEKMLLSSITVSMLKKTKGFYIERQPVLFGVKTSLTWPKETKSFTWKGYAFAVLNNKIVAFKAYSYSSGFWNKTLTKHYDFPVTYKEAVEVFGEPDAIYDFWGP